MGRGPDPGQCLLGAARRIWSQAPMGWVGLGSGAAGFVFSAVWGSVGWKIGASLTGGRIDDDGLGLMSSVFTLVRNTNDTEYLDGVLVRASRVRGGKHGVSASSPVIYYCTMYANTCSRQSLSGSEISPCTVRQETGPGTAPSCRLQLLRKHAETPRAPNA